VRTAGLHAVYSLTTLEPDTGVCMREAPRLLRQTGELIARDLASGRAPGLALLGNRVPSRWLGKLPGRL
jgi:hypothetical protein